MKRLWHNLTAQMLLACALFTVLTLPALAAPDAEELKRGDNLIDSAIGLLRSESREETTYPQLVNGGIDGMTLLIESKKLSSSFLKHVDDDASREDCLNHLHAQYAEAAERYPELFKHHILTMEAVNGIMKTVDDPYTVFLNPFQYKSLNEAMTGGNFGGIGVVIGLDKEKEETVTIISVMDDAPASRAGLKTMDQIIKIDGKPTKGLTLKQTSDRLRGEEGSKVVLTIKRPNAADMFDATVTREKIHVSSVSSKMIEKDGHKIGHVRLNIFGESTNLETEKAMRKLDSEGAEAFIIDVRGNSGGYVSAAVDVCSKFLPTGSRVVSIVERKRPEQVLKSRPNLRKQKPMAVLIDGDSASASEITAGAIHDLKRGKLIGVKSFGKGSVQKIYPMQFPQDEVSAFKITTAHYHTPAGHDIHKAGIEPDYKVELDPKATDDKDPQLDKACEVLVEEIKEADAKKKPQDVAVMTKATDIADETSFITKALGTSDWTVIERVPALSKDGKSMTEKVKVKEATGKVSVFEFDISSCLGL